MSTIRFFLPPDKKDKQGRQPIMMIYQLSGTRKYFSTQRKIFAGSWDNESQRAVYRDKKEIKKYLAEVEPILIPTAIEIKDINDKLEEFIKDVEKIERRFNEDKTEYNEEIVIEKLKEIHKPNIRRNEATGYVFNFIDQYIKDHESTREPGSLGVYKSLKNHLKDFQETKGVKVVFSEMDKKFFQRFQDFLAVPRKKFVTNRKYAAGGREKIVRLNNTTIAKQLSTLKTFLGYAKVHDINVSDKYKEFPISKPKLEVIALTNDEFELLFNLDLSKNIRLDRVRDIFCFSCVTGFRYSDLNRLRWEHIKKDEINKVIEKTDTPLIIPLNPYSRAILKKYEGKQFPLPVITNQRLNVYIKELCRIAGINEPMEIVRTYGNKKERITYPKYELTSIHTGRKTFATVSLERGMPSEIVQKTGGWEDRRSFERYINITEERKKLAMQKAWGKIEAPKTAKRRSLKAV